MKKGKLTKILGIITAVLRAGGGGLPPPAAHDDGERSGVRVYVELYARRPRAAGRVLPEERHELHESGGLRSEKKTPF